MQVFVRIIVALLALGGAGGSFLVGAAIHAVQDETEKDFKAKTGMTLSQGLEGSAANAQANLSPNTNVDDVNKLLELARRVMLSFWFLYAAAGFGVLGMLFACFGKGKSAGLLLLVAPAGPFALLPQVVWVPLAIFVGALPVAGLLAFCFVRVRSPRPAREDAYGD
jgi:hypothetical protein